MTTYHTVMPGENLSSIARKFGLGSWKDIYKYDANKGFRERRPNENLIFPGDIVAIPDGSAAPKVASVPGQAAVSCDSKSAAVAIVKTSAWLDVNTKALLSPGLVTGILAAEARRLSWWEREGLDGDTKGPGQIGQPLYTDVINNLKPELGQFLVHMGTNCGASLRRGCGVSRAPLVQKGFPQDVIDPLVSDFFIAAALAVKVRGSLKPGRSPDDQLQFGIGLYSGGLKSIVAAQMAISPQDQGASVLAYEPVKRHLQGSGDKIKMNVAAYVDEVYRCR